MNFVIVLLMSIPLSSRCWNCCPSNINYFDGCLKETTVCFFTCDFQYLSSEWLNRLVAAKYLEFHLGRIDKIQLKPELHNITMFATQTEEIEIDPYASYQTMSLDIFRCSLTSIPRHLHRLTLLSELNFGRNKIESVNMDELNELKNLKYINLSNNKIKVFGATIKISFPKLEKLDLRFNQLSTFVVRDWSLPSLRELLLYANNLRHVVLNPRTFPKLYLIDLLSNPLNGDWLRDYREEFNIKGLKIAGYCNGNNSNGSFYIDIDCNAQCGQKQKIIIETIVKGHDTARGSWPWHAAVYRNNGTHMEYICGGTLISRTFILSAAHCVVNPYTRQTISSHLLQIKLGMHVLDKVERGTQEFMVDKIYKYANFTQHVNDISLLKLIGKAVFSALVQPICIVDSGDLTGQYGTVVGWGLRSDDKFATVLQSSQMPVYGTLDCLESSRLFFAHALHRGMWCAGYSNGTSICNGDSGGGMYFQRNNTWYIGGIVAFSESRPGNLALCKTDGYGGFTNVTHHVTWIKKIVEL